MLGGITDALGLTDSGAIDKAYKNASNETRAMMDRLDKVDLPDSEKLKILMQSPELVGLLEAEGIPATELANIQTDPRLEQDTMTALQGLRDRSKQGLTAEDKFATEELLNQVNANEMAQRKSLEQEAARQGITDSGIAAAAQISARQNQANNARQQAMQMAAQGAQQRMAATQGLGSLSGQVQGQQFNQKAQVASAKDSIAQANAANRQSVNQFNLANRQNIENQRTSIANQQQAYDAGLEQQRFQNQLSKAGAQNQVGQNLAGMFMGQAQAKAASDAATTGALISGGAAIAASDKNVKINVKEGSSPIRQLMDKLSPYEYDYKPEVVENANDLGKQLGVMAQDLEKSPLGAEFVQEDMNGVKRVDYGKMGSTQMAAIADVHQRVNKLEKLLKMLGIDTEEL